MRSAVVLVVFVAACGDFPTPAELTKPTILAVIADPAVVTEGESTTLRVVVAGPDGPMTPDVMDWALIETFHDVPPFGTLVDNSDGTATYTAPEELPELPEGAVAIDSVQLTMTADDTTVTSIKAVAVTDLPAVNPAITTMVVGEVDAENGMHVAADVAYPVEVTIDPEPTENATYAWYSTVGGIEEYQSNPAELIASDEAGEGWLFVVVRDRGGVAVRGVELTVE